MDKENTLPVQSQSKSLGKKRQKTEDTPDLPQFSDLPSSRENSSAKAGPSRTYEAEKWAAGFNFVAGVSLHLHNLLELLTLSVAFLPPVTLLTFVSVPPVHHSV